jgi:L-serine dehydratase
VKHSLFELFKIGIGPSSSHTMGPMRAALRFAGELESTGLTSRTASILVDLYGSLALTGFGHGTDRAILLGLSGHTPEGIDPAKIDAILGEIRAARKVELPGHRMIRFDEAKHLIFHRDQMYPVANIVSHPNGVRFSAFDQDGALLSERIFYSIGGGFIVSEEERAAAEGAQTPADNQAGGVPYPFHSAQELLGKAAAANITISQLMLANECALVESGETSAEEVRRGILHIWQIMRECTQRGIEAEGILPGGLKVRRRAAKLAARLRAGGRESFRGGLWSVAAPQCWGRDCALGNRKTPFPNWTGSRFTPWRSTRKTPQEAVS